MVGICSVAPHGLHPLHLSVQLGGRDPRDFSSSSSRSCSKDLNVHDQYNDDEDDDVIDELTNL